MGIRSPKNFDGDPLDITWRNEKDPVKEVTRVFKITNGQLILYWEGNTSTFLDCNGDIFYDKTGVPFQGKQE